MKKIRKVTHGSRKFFGERDHGPYQWGDAAAQAVGNMRYPRWYNNWGRLGSGAKSHDNRTRREIENADDRRLEDQDHEFN